MVHDRSMLKDCSNWTCRRTLLPRRKRPAIWRRPCDRKPAPILVWGSRAFPASGPEVPTAATSHGIDMSGTLHVALASGDNVRVKSFPIASHPAITKARSAKQALNMLRLALLNRE